MGKKRLHINFILPFVTSKPGGGFKVMYEYANRLAISGHTITIIHSIKRPDKKIKSPVWFKKLKYLLNRGAYPGWFSFHSTVKSIVVTEICDRYIPDADIIIGTWWATAFSIAALSPEKGRKFNLIQDYETWTNESPKVHESYRLPIQHIVIAKYLEEIVSKDSPVPPLHIPNAIDISVFKILQSPIERNPETVCMLFSEEERKGTKFGLEALINLKSTVPALQVTLFGVFEKPANLPNWISYQYKPKDLCKLYNEHSIFLSPSLGEGWALPPAEAMACGCAVVCTDIGGHKDYGIEGQTCHFVPPASSFDIEKALSFLIENSSKRAILGIQGSEYISSKFNWECSTALLEETFYHSLGTL